MSEEFRTAERRLLARYGLAAEERFFPVPGGTGRALVVGDGPPLVLVPGGGAPAAGWAPLVAELGDFRVHLLELPGFGVTELLPRPARPLREAAVGYLEAALGGLGLARAPFVSNSMGALWTVWLALDRPSLVSSMALLGCPALLLGTSAPLPMRLISVPVLGSLMIRLQRPSERQVVRTLASAGIDLSGHDELRDLALALERLPSFAKAWPQLLHAAVRLRGARSETALGADELATVRQPVRLIWGERDPFGAPEVGRAAARILPHADIHVVPGGHSPWLDDPRGVAGLTGPFLAERRRAA